MVPSTLLSAKFHAVASALLLYKFFYDVVAIIPPNVPHRNSHEREAI